MSHTTQACKITHNKSQNSNRGWGRGHGRGSNNSSRSSSTVCLNKSEENKEANSANQGEKKEEGGKSEEKTESGLSVYEESFLTPVNLTENDEQERWPILLFK